MHTSAPSHSPLTAQPAARAMEEGPGRPGILERPAGAAGSLVEVIRLAGPLEDPVLILAPLTAGCPVVGISRGFAALSGGASDALPGKGFEALLRGAPSTLVSKSGLQTVEDFFRQCAREDLASIAPTSMVQPLVQDGSFFVAFCLFGLTITSHDRRFIVGVVLPFGADVPSSSRKAELREEATAALDRTRAHLSETLGGRVELPAPPSSGQRPPFAFFEEQLRGQAVLTRGGFTAERREFEEVPKGCMVYGDRPVLRSAEGLAFVLRVDGATRCFHGMPLLGFTRRRPSCGSELYPLASRCQAASVLVGCAGEAFARDQLDHFKMGFSKPPSEQVEEFLPEGSHNSVPELEIGDEIGCRYTWEGQLQLQLNGKLLLDFDVRRPIEKDVDYFAVVDVCFSATALTILPYSTAGSEQETASELSRCEALDLSESNSSVIGG